jgi:hypothetical protein
MIKTYKKKSISGDVSKINSFIEVFRVFVRAFLGRFILLREKRNNKSLGTTLFLVKRP